MKSISLLSIVLLLYSVSAFGQQAGHVKAKMDTLCPGIPGSLTLTNNTDSIIQWQLSTNDSSFTDLPGADSTFYLTAPLLTTTWFRAVVSNGSSSAYSDTIQLLVGPPITAAFTYTIDETTVHFNSGNSSGNIVRYFWDFGDGDTSNLANPVHTYSLDTLYYNPCLTIFDAFNCAYTFCRSFDIIYDQGHDTTGVPTLQASNNWAVYPSPFNNQLTVVAKQKNNPAQTIEMYNLLGQQVFFKNTANMHGLSYPLPMPNLSSGMYYLVIKTAAANYVQKVLRQ